MGEYTISNGAVSLNPRETGVLIVHIAATQNKKPYTYTLGTPNSVPGADGTAEVFVYRRGDTEKDVLRANTVYDVIEGGSIKTFTLQADGSGQSATPDPMPQAASTGAGSATGGGAASGGGTTSTGTGTAGGGAQGSGAATQGAAAGKSTTHATDPKFNEMDPHYGAGSVQDKIKNVGVAVKKNFEDVTDEPAEMLTLEDVTGNPENLLAGHTWITNSASDRAKFNLNDWTLKTPGGQDPYTYFALVNDETKEPICFVVASDPEENAHWSTGRFIGPDSKRQNLRRAFCYLFHRATGHVHSSCIDNNPENSEDDVPRGSGGGRGGGRGRGSGAGAGKGGSSGGADGTGSSVATGGPSLSVKMKGTDIVRGKGDPQARFLRSVALERVSKGGIKFYTRAKTRFDAMGPGGTPTPAILKMGQKANGKDPITLVVTFKNPVNIDTTKVVENPDGSQRKMLMLTTLSPNKGPEDIESIGFYYKKGAAWFRENVMGFPRSPGSAVKKLTAKNDPEAFAAAAKWVFSNPQEFDLGEDIEFRSPEGAGAGGGKTSTAELQGGSMDESAIRKARSTMSVTPLFDRYRF